MLLIDFDLITLIMDATDYANLVHKNAKEISAKELERWEASMELLEIKKLEMDIQSTLVLEARAGLDEAIEQLVEEERLKEAEIADNDHQIQEVEKRISNVVAEFNETQGSIKAKHANLQSAQSKIDSESEALIIKKNEIDDFLSVAEQKSSKLMELAEAEKKVAVAARNFKEAGWIASEAKESEGLILLKEKEAAKAGYKKLRLISAAARAERS
uniref:Uncharacterized protein n=1 Tax=Ananas comosus var. bracteatus TaxID=296719 RepID=A0A6V7PUM2_ANACO|nr:unnamed protein product [Ananas comosus var. bracteatus]